MNLETLTCSQIDTLQSIKTLNELANPLKANLPALATAPNRLIPLALNESFDLPEIDSECLPMWLSGYLYTISMQNQVPPDVMTILGLDILSCCLQKKFVVSPYEDNHRIEHLNLWTLTASDISNKKNLLDTLTRPISEWEKEQVEKKVPAQISSEVFQDFSKRTARLIINKAARIEAEDITRSKTSRDYVTTDNHEPKRLLYEAERVKTRAPEYSPAPPNIIANYVTQKSLPAELVASYGKLALISDDSSLVKVMNSPYFLRGYSGGPQRLRLGKRDIFLNEVTTAVGLIVSTDRLKELFNAREFSKSQESLAKSLFCLSNTNTGRRNIRESQIDPQLTQYAKQTYDCGISLLLDRSSLAPLDKATGRYLPRIIRMTDEALEVWLQFREWLESESGERGKFEYLQGWIDNLPGVALRIAGLIYIASLVDQNIDEALSPLSASSTPSFQNWDGELKISEEILKSSIELCMKLIAHGQVAYNIITNDKAIADARFALSWLVNHLECDENGAFYIRKNALHSSSRFSKSKAARVDKTLDILTACNVLGPPARLPTRKPTYIRYVLDPRLPDSISN